MRCRTVLTRVDALRTGELRPAESHDVHDHLRKCRSCEESFEDLGALALAVKSLAVAPPRSCRDAVAPHDSFDRVGDCWVAFTERGLRMISRRGTADQFRAAYAKRYGRALMAAPIPDRLREQVRAALEGEASGRPRIDIETVSELEDKVMQALVSIPRGEVRSYSWLAQKVGKPKAVRAVANFVARNIVPFVVPCHRVVPAGGGVGKYAFGSDMKRELLRKEGVDVDQLDALARKGIRFIGSKTTNIVCFPTCHAARRIREENRVPFPSAEDALKEGFRPCKHCQPFAA